MIAHDPTLEYSVLRYVLAAPTSWRRLGSLAPDDLAIPAHREILATIRDIAAREHPTSGLVLAALRRAGRHEAARVVLEALRGDATTLAEVSGAVEHLRRLARQRRLHEPLVMALAQVDAGDLDGAKAAVAALAEALAADVDDDGWPWMRDDADVVTAAVEAMRTSESHPVIDVEGWRDFGEHLTPGNLAVVAGETGAGKSSLALWLAQHWHRARGTRVGIVSLEDRDAVWGRRRIAQVAGVDIDRPERITRWQAEDMLRHIEDIKAADAIRYAILEDHDVEHVTRYARGLVERAGCGLVIVDYLQEIGDAAASRKGLPQHERLSGIARAIKGVAKRSRVPVVLVSQLARPDSKRHREPTIYDIKGSGDVENMAEAIVLLWKESDDEGAAALAKVAKLKDSPKRVRSVIRRNAAGAIEELHAAPREQPQDVARFRD